MRTRQEINNHIREVHPLVALPDCVEKELLFDIRQLLAIIVMNLSARPQDQEFIEKLKPLNIDKIAEDSDEKLH